MNYQMEGGNKPKDFREALSLSSLKIKHKPIYALASVIQSIQCINSFNCYFSSHSNFTLHYP